MSTLAYARSGSGDPLLLLHPLGSSRAAWEPVVPLLAESFDVVAVDLPGFGDSPPLPPGVEPAPAALARAVAELLDELGLRSPAVAGNSLGGWVALELARLRPLASLTLLSPAGLWPGRTPRYCLVSLRATRWVCRHAGGPLSRLVRWRVGRAVAFAQILGRPARMSPELATAAIRAIGRGTGFDATLRATADRHWSGPLAGTPVTVAFGSRDRLLLGRRWRRVDELPAGPTVAALPGCGHVPRTDDPAAVVALIASSARRPDAAARPD